MEEKVSGEFVPLVGGTKTGAEFFTVALVYRRVTMVFAIGRHYHSVILYAWITVVG